MRLLDEEGNCLICKAHYFEHSVADMEECKAAMQAALESIPTLEEVIAPLVLAWAQKRTAPHKERE